MGQPQNRRLFRRVRTKFVNIYVLSSDHTVRLLWRMDLIKANIAGFGKRTVDVLIKQLTNVDAATSIQFSKYMRATDQATYPHLVAVYVDEFAEAIRQKNPIFADSLKPTLLISKKKKKKKEEEDEDLSWFFDREKNAFKVAMEMTQPLTLEYAISVAKKRERIENTEWYSSTSKRIADEESRWIDEKLNEIPVPTRTTILQHCIDEKLK